MISGYFDVTEFILASILPLKYIWMELFNKYSQEYENLDISIYERPSWILRFSLCLW